MPYDTDILVFQFYKLESIASCLPWASYQKRKILHIQMSYISTLRGPNLVRGTYPARMQLLSTNKEISALTGGFWKFIKTEWGLHLQNYEINEIDNYLCFGRPGNELYLEITHDDYSKTKYWVCLYVIYSH